MTEGPSQGERRELAPAETAAAPDAGRTVTAATRGDTLAPAEGLQPGERIDRYTVLERVGAGGMGEVYAAFDNRLDRKVALKLLRHRSEGYEARLMREAQAMARLLHPNVVAVFDAGVVGGRLYLAMEFVRGVTLRAWQKRGTRSIQEILRHYTEAGRGLAAAHAAGLVHRDFKPDNVLIGDDGQVKVTDFGIARAVDERGASDASKPASELGGAAEEAPAPTGESSDPSLRTASATTLPTGSGLLDNPITEAGTLLGTPGYMAPEQFLCEAVDERTDQFSFCVSLYEALYGVKPFWGSAEKRPSMKELAEATLVGDIDAPPKGTAVPAHLRRVLVRGLSPERDERYPSMQALLDDLARDPDRQRRRRLALTATGALVVAGVTWFAAGAVEHRAALRAGCAAEGAAIYEHWGPSQREAMRASMLGDPGTAAPERAGRAVATLDKFAKAWQSEQESSCTATRLAKTQTEETHERRTGCLLGGRQAFDDLVEILTERDAAVHRQSLELIARVLSPPRLCGRNEAERAFTPLPAEPKRRALVEQARSLTTRAQVAKRSGRNKESVAAAERGVALAHQADAPADEAAALIVLGDGLAREYDMSKAMARYYDAVQSAERAGDDRAAALAAKEIALNLGLADALNQPEQAPPWFGIAWAKLARLGKDDFLEAELLHARASLDADRGDTAASLDASERASAHYRALYGEASLYECNENNNRGVSHFQQNDPEGALVLYREAIACWETAVGGDRAAFLANAGEVLLALGRFAEAADALRRTRELRLELGPQDPVAAESLARLALAEEGLGRFHEAERDAREALGAAERRGTDGRAVGSVTLNTRANALAAIGIARAALGDARGARSHCERAVAQLEDLKALTAGAFMGVVDPLRCLGEAELALGDVQGAREHLTRDVALTKRLLIGDLARARFALARAQALPPNPDLARARELASIARDDLQREVKRAPSLGAALADVERWIEEHP